jgi:diguanylate cyclase (GGDEF)-like protein
MDSKHLLSIAINLIDAGLIVIDANQAVLLWNAWLVRRSGMSAHRVQDKQLRALFPGIGGTRVEAAIDQALAGSGPFRLPHTSIRAPFPLRAAGQLDGDYIEQEVTVSPVRDQDGSFKCMIEIRDASAYAAREDQHFRHAEGLRALTYLDGLTGIANRRQFDATLDREIRRAQRNGTELALLLLDIDSFKAYNDYFGHLKGDECLRTVAQTIDAMARRSADVVCRYGGEEFAVILPDSGPQQARVFAESICARVRSLGLPHSPQAAHPSVTVSIGLASCVPGVGGDADELIGTADQALYAAKHGGRDMVELLDARARRA